MHIFSSVDKVVSFLRKSPSGKERNEVQYECDLNTEKNHVTDMIEKNICEDQYIKLTRVYKEEYSDDSFFHLISLERDIDDNSINTFFVIKKDIE